ncbi:MAG: DoxX family membrane protein [Alistipes sp.]|nr:DoxX family membrane protein [Alistipes sp.]
MAQPLRDRVWFVGVATVCRILFAATFIVSGSLKAVDPWGTILILENYLVAYNVALPEWLTLVASLLLCGLELAIGLLLLLKVQTRVASFVALVTMLFFTIITLLSATVVPVEDCGCFGEAIKLTPWQTFAKNLVLLPMAACLWYRHRIERLFDGAPSKVATLWVTLLLSFGLGIYCYRHLPLIDFLPYKVGVNIAEQMRCELSQSHTERVVLVYRNRTTGELRDFAVEDTEWQNDALWEWVDTRTESVDNGHTATILEFQIADEEGNDVTTEILALPKVYLLLCESVDIDAEVEEKFDAVERYVAENGGEVIRITANQPSPSWYSMDAKTMKTLLRAKYGLVVLEQGSITAKYNFCDIPY